MIFYNYYKHSVSLFSFTAEAEALFTTMQERLLWLWG